MTLIDDVTAGPRAPQSMATERPTSWPTAAELPAPQQPVPRHRADEPGPAQLPTPQVAVGFAPDSEPPASWSPAAEAAGTQPAEPEIAPEPIPDADGALEWTGPGGLLDGSDGLNGPEAPRAPSTVVVFSPKGGVGTTFLAVNLAIALSERGRRRVCVVDLDLEFGDVAIVAGLSPNRGIADAVGQSLADDQILDGVLTMLSTGVDCVLAPIDPAAADQVSADLVALLLARLRERYEYVVIDTPSQLTEGVLEAFDVAEHHVLVTTPGLPALKNLRLMLDTLDLLGTSESARTIVLNQAAEKSGLERADVEEILGRPVAAVIPASPDVAASIDVGTPLLGRRRDTAVAAAVRAFVAQTFVGDPQPAGRRGLRLGPRTRKRSS